MLSASKPTSTFIRSSPWTSLASSSPMSSGPRGQCADEHLREHSGLPDGRHESSCPAKLRHAVFQWLARSHKRTRGRFRAGHRRALLSVPDARYVDGRVRVPRLAHKWNAGRQLSRDASRLDRLDAPTASSRSSLPRRISRPPRCTRIQRCSGVYGAEGKESGGQWEDRCPFRLSVFPPAIALKSY